MIRREQLAEFWEIADEVESRMEIREKVFPEESYF